MFFKSDIFEGMSFMPKNFACYAGADVTLLDEKNNYLAIPQENVLLCHNLCPICTHIQVAIKKVISTFSYELAEVNNKRFNTFE